MTREAALDELLGLLFSAAELRVYLARGRDGGQLIQTLPEVGVSPQQLYAAAVELLKRRGLLDRDFFDDLQARFPKRTLEIHKVRSLWLHNPRLDCGERWAEGRYRLESACGRGGFGLVWKAVDTTTGAFVALKILLEQHSDDHRVRQRFFRGAEVLAKLHHPAIVGVRSGVEQEGLRFFYVMDFIDGVGLDVLVGQRPRDELLEYVLQVGDALAHLHAHELLHRDIKPSNILVTAKRQAKLLDFDLVTGDAYAPMTTRALGTAIYAPPEAGASDQKTAAYDVFSLARTAEYVIRGREPRVAELGARDPVATLETAEAVKVVLRAALRRDPMQRTQTVEQFCAALRAALKPPRSAARPPAQAPRTPSQAPPPPVHRPLAVANRGELRPAIGGREASAPKQAAPAPTSTEPDLVAILDSTLGPPSEAPRHLGRDPRVLKFAAVLLSALITVITVIAVLPDPEPPAQAELPTSKASTEDSGLSADELTQTRTAIRDLGLKDSNKAQTAMQQIIDDPQRSPKAVTQARLAQAELLLMRALACKIAVTIEPSALNGQAQTRAVEDPVQAAEVLAGVGPGADPDQLRRVQTLQTLVAGQSTAELPPGSEDLAALIKGAPLWRGETRVPPAGLITSLQRVANPSTLGQSVLALALWRSGDIDGAQALLRAIVERIGDQPVASTILAAIDRQNLVNENGDPEVPMPPSDPEPAPPTSPGGADKTAEPVVRPPVAPSVTERAEVMVSTGCQKVRQGDPAGIKLLLEAVDRHPETLKNFNLCFCLGTGFARQESHDAALSWYRRSHWLSPANRDAIAGAARSAELLGRTTEAIGFYKQLHVLDPGNASANKFLAKHDGGPQPDPAGDEEPSEILPLKGD
jgi:serine/threonine protein kinase/tetratricopeptide (TPR) repeat protein